MHNGRRVLRFGAFEADLHSGEVRKSGSRIKLQDQPFKVLQLLLEHPGELVTREELQSRIWPQENFGDFDHAVNVAVGKLRTALGDSADNPSFIETVPRRGYRFVARLEVPSVDTYPAKVPAIGASAAGGMSRVKRTLLASLAIAVSGILLALGIFLGRHATRWQPPEFQRLTMRHGTVYSARFAPDGRNVIYSASWDGAPVEIFSADLRFPGAQNLGLPATQLLAVSSSGEMAVLQSVDHRFLLTGRGILGQVPLTGGSPSPDRREYRMGGLGSGRKKRSPLSAIWRANSVSNFRWAIFFTKPTAGSATPAYRPKAAKSHFSTTRTAMTTGASFRSSILRDARGFFPRAGKARKGWHGLRTEPRFGSRLLRLDSNAVSMPWDLSAHQRTSFRAPGGVTLQDIAPDGRLLLTRDEQRAGMMALAPGTTKERDLSWLDWSLPVNLSPDGNTLLFDEQGEEGGATYTVAVRDMRGSPPIPLGEGMAGDFSPDGKWATTIVSYTQLLLLPTGAGTVKRIERGDIQQYGDRVHWLPDGKQIIFSGNQPGRAARCFIQNVEGGKPRPLTPEGVSSCQVSPDGKLIAASGLIGMEGRLYAMDGGPPRPIPGLLPGETFAWTSDSRFMYAYQWKQAPVKIYRLNILSGQRQLFREVNPADVTGLCDMFQVLFSSDGQAYVYGYIRLLSDLYLVKGLK